MRKYLKSQDNIYEFRNQKMKNKRQLDGTKLKQRMILHKLLSYMQKPE